MAMNNSWRTIKYDKIKNYKSKKFRRITGVRREIFEKMIKILVLAKAKLQRKGGPESTLSIEDMLLVALEYWREYRTYAHIAASFGVHESTIFRIVRWVEDVLIKSGAFSLPGKKVLRYSAESGIEIILIDATESPIERPKRGQSKYYSGRKKRHTMKTIVIVEKATQRIICLVFANGKRHDFRVFKESGINIDEAIKVLTDTGFIGIKKLHANSEHPRKKEKKKKLSKEDKIFNKKVSRERVVNENVIGFVKRFRILSDRYRNRRKRFGLRFNLIAGICNLDIANSV